MAKIKMYSNDDVARMSGQNIETVKKYSQKPQNGINYVEIKTRKIYIWFDGDIERFKNREVVMGRPKKPV